MTDNLPFVDVDTLKLSSLELNFCPSLACIIVCNNQKTYNTSFTFMLFLICPPYQHKFLHLVIGMHEFVHGVVCFVDYMEEIVEMCMNMEGK